MEDRGNCVIKILHPDGRFKGNAFVIEGGRVVTANHNVMDDWTTDDKELEACGDFRPVGDLDLAITLSKLSRLGLPVSDLECCPGGMPVMIIGEISEGWFAIEGQIDFENRPGQLVQKLAVIAGESVVPGMSGSRVEDAATGEIIGAFTDSHGEGKEGVFARITPSHLRHAERLSKMM